MELIFFILVLIPALVLFFVWSLKRFNEWCYLRQNSESLPPGDMGWPLIGNTLSFYLALRSTGPNSLVHNLLQRYGKTGIYKSHMFGSPSIIVCQPETCKKVLSDDHNFKFGYPLSPNHLGANSSGFREGAEHKRLRKLMTAAISGPQALTLYIGLIEDIVVTSLDEWACFSMSMDRPIELLSELKQLVLKIISNIFLGPNCGDMSKEFEKLCTDVTEALTSMPINIPGFAFHKACKAYKKLEKALLLVIEERRMESNRYQEEKETSMLDMLLKARDDETGENLNNEDIKEVLFVLFFAAHKTTSYAMMWVVSYLHEHPQIFQTLKEEQEKIVKNRLLGQKGLTLNEIRQMNCLAKAIQETLRMANIAILIMREAKADVNINGYTIPKGWKVLVDPRGVHMDPTIYPNPNDYDPSRWNNNMNAKPGTYLSFGYGSRLCPGAEIAKLQVSIFLHYFLLGYRVERSNPRCPINYLPLPMPTDKFLAKIIKC